MRDVIDFLGSLYVPPDIGIKALTAYLGSDQSAWADYDATRLMESKGPFKKFEIMIDQGTKDKVCLRLLGWQLSYYKLSIATNSFSTKENNCCLRLFERLVRVCSKRLFADPVRSRVQLPSIFFCASSPSIIAKALTTRTFLWLRLSNNTLSFTQKLWQR